MYLNLVTTGTPSPAPPIVTLVMETSGETVIPFQGGRPELDSPTVAGFLGVAVGYDRVGPAPAPDAGESRFQLRFFLASGSLEAMRSTVWSIRIDASGGGSGQSFSWTVTDRADDAHTAILPRLATRRATVTGPLTVGSDAAAATITRFTGEAIDAMSTANLAATVPTSGGVKAHVAGVVAGAVNAAVAGAVNAAVTGTVGSYAKFTDVHVLGASAVSEASGTVTVKGTLSVNSGAAASSTLNVLGAATLQSTLNVTGGTTLGQLTTTGDHKHGIRTLLLGAANLMPLGPLPLTYSATTARGSGGAHGVGGIFAPVPLHVGDRVTVIRVRLLDVPGLTVFARLLRAETITDTSLIATSPVSSGTGAVQILTINAAAVLVAGGNYLVAIQLASGSGEFFVGTVEIDYDRL